MTVTTARLAQCITDDSSVILAVDEAYVEVVGRARHEVVGRSPLEFTVMADRCVNDALLRRLKRHGCAFSITKRYVRGDGTLQWVSNHVSAFRDGAGPRRFIATCQPQCEPAVAGDIARVRRDVVRLIDMVALAKHGFGGDLIAAPALEMMLHLLMAEMECRSLTPLCLANMIGQSAATTVRWARVLAQRGRVEVERHGPVDQNAPLRITGEAQRLIEAVASTIHPQV